MIAKALLNPPKRQDTMNLHMSRIRKVALYAVSLLGVGVAVCGMAFGQTVETCKTTDPFCFQPQLTSTTDRLDAVSQPRIATPAWLSAAGGSTQSGGREVTYVAATKGNVSANFNEFKTQVNETLNSPEGWSRLGVRFVRVESGGQFTVWLSEASQVPSFSPSGCDAVVSCTVGNNVIINETRWLNGSDAWNGAGGSLRNYRHMVVNHETGHWLGHGHEYCSGAGQPASVMQQQTINMQGCAPNPWPLAHELYAPKLGIRS
ncbi:TPA: hypothetical protein DCF80_03520 [Candidatus Saccharibacteria bacterium]|nr:hypothetical protein [Candidatus Saccharibacteria bacterium]